MHPIVILLPAAALVFGPRLWVRHVLKQHDCTDESLPASAAEVARAMLDRHGLQGVRVESTDIGDHYDPDSKAVRLAREKFDGKTLTAVTTAAHEAAHAMQDASGYGPFVWRTRLVKVAQATGEIGSIILLAIPAASLLGRRAIPPSVIITAGLGMLGTGVAAQLAALPSELDASFGRALPMLRDGYISREQVADARKILTACSLTYIASSLVGVLHIWPWLGRGRVIPAPPTVQRIALTQADQGLAVRQAANRSRHPSSGERRPRKGTSHSVVEGLVRRLGKPLIRSWFRVRRAR